MAQTVIRTAVVDFKARTADFSNGVKKAAAETKRFQSQMKGMSSAANFAKGFLSFEIAKKAFIALRDQGTEVAGAIKKMDASWAGLAETIVNQKDVKGYLTGLYSIVASISDKIKEAAGFDILGSGTYGQTVRNFAGAGEREAEDAARLKRSMAQKPFRDQADDMRTQLYRRPEEDDSVEGKVAKAYHDYEDELEKIGDIESGLRKSGAWNENKDSTKFGQMRTLAQSNFALKAEKLRLDEKREQWKVEKEQREKEQEEADKLSDKMRDKFKELRESSMKEPGAGEGTVLERMGRVSLGYLAQGRKDEEAKKQTELQRQLVALFAQVAGKQIGKKSLTGVPGLVGQALSAAGLA